MKHYDKKKVLVSRAVYAVLVLPLIPLALLCYLGDKLTKAKWANAWVDWAANKARDITGV